MKDRPSEIPLPTLQSLIDRGFPLDRPFILQDPDTYWLLVPTFFDDGEHIIITGDYTERRSDLEK